MAPGDLAVWDGHVAMMVGNGMVSKRVINGGPAGSAAQRAYDFLGLTGTD